jgi:hypothetical protein
MTFALKKNLPIIKAGRARLAPVDTIIVGFSFKNIKKISTKLNKSLGPLVPCEI